MESTFIPIKTSRNEFIGPVLSCQLLPLVLIFCHNQGLGGVAEWTIAPVLKTGVPRGTGGSNPSPSADWVHSGHILYNRVNHVQVSSFVRDENS